MTSAVGLRAGAVALAAGYAVGAAYMSTFTWQAALLTALPIGTAAVLAVANAATRPGAGAGALRLTRAQLWLAALAAVVAWELFSFFSSPRSQHPTISSMLDAFMQWHAAKALVFLAWLLAGWYLVRQ